MYVLRRRKKDLEVTNQLETQSKRAERDSIKRSLPMELLVF